MRVSVLADLPGHSVATTSTHTTKLERFDKIKLVAKVISETNFRDGLSAFRINNSLLTKLEHRILEKLQYACVYLETR